MRSVCLAMRWPGDTVDLSSRQTLLVGSCWYIVSHTSLCCSFVWYARSWDEPCCCLLKVSGKHNPCPHHVCTYILIYIYNTYTRVLMYILWSLQNRDMLKLGAGMGYTLPLKKVRQPSHPREQGNVVWGHEKYLYGTCSWHGTYREALSSGELR